MKYENKKNGVVATLVEENEKTKTVILEKEDGSTIPITTSTLKRWWKKLPEEVEQTEPIKEAAKPVTKDDKDKQDVSMDGTPYKKVMQEIVDGAKDKANKASTGKKSKSSKSREMAEYIKDAQAYIFDIVNAEGDEIFVPNKDIKMRSFKVGGHMYCKFNFSNTSITIAIKDKVLEDIDVRKPDKIVNHAFGACFTYKKALTGDDKKEIVKLLKAARNYRILKNKKEDK